MKSAYEIAMEKMKAAAGPQRKLNEAQKKRLAEIDKKYTARAAEAKLSFEARLASSSFEERENLQAELASDLARIEEKREAEKDQVWKEG